MEMRAVAATVGAEEAAVRALAAGVDAVCLGHDLPVEPVHAAIVDAVALGPSERGAPVGGRLGGRPSGATDRLDAERACDRLLGGATGAARRRRSAAARDTARGRARPHGEHRRGSERLRARRRRPGAHGRTQESSASAHASELAELDAGPLVLVLRDAGRHGWQRELAAQLVAAHEDVVVVETGLPGWAPEGVRALLTTHGAGRANLEAAAELLAPL